MSRKSNYLALLGYRVKDKVTGVEGVIESVCFDLYGCVVATVNRGIDKDGAPTESRWYDVKRLMVTSAEPVMLPPDFEAPEIGAADKPTR